MAVREVARVEYGNRDHHGLERPEPARGLDILRIIAASLTGALEAAATTASRWLPASVKNCSGEIPANL
jgi:hypothetical protein